MLHGLGRFLRLTNGERSLLAEAVRSLAWARLAVMLVPFRRLAPALSKRRLAPTRGDVPAQLGRISWAIQTASRRLPWRCKCLEQAIAGKIMLRRRGIANVLWLGAANDRERGLAAHAWLQSGARVITGGTEGGRHYAALTSFIDGEETQNDATGSELTREEAASGNATRPRGQML